MNTPLMLSLARTAYARADPRALLAAELDSEEALRGHLLDHVLTVAYPDQRERDHAHYWLGWLAHHMNSRPEGRTRDLGWWHIPTYLPRWQLRFGGGLVVGFVRGLVVGFVVGFVRGLVYGLGGSAAAALTAAEGALALRGRRVRFFPLLETALERQVLRQAGAVYQFRHAELQDRLAARFAAMG